MHKECKQDFNHHFIRLNQEIQNQGLWKSEVLLQGPQDPVIRVGDQEWINFCANNYLGLSNHPEIISAAKKGLEDYGFGMSSVRFICGTQDQHKKLEQELAAFVGTEDAILYSSCFDANGGLFETLLTEEDAVVSDALNHASIIDGIRLSKARRFRYENRNMADLEAKLQEARNQESRFILIATDGVFSMDGTIAPLPEILDLAHRYGAQVMVDDSHAVGFYGPHGSGTPSAYGLHGKIDLITGTLGKALGGASGGYIAGPSEVIAYLRQRSRPYLFSNSLAPSITQASLMALTIIRNEPQRLETLCNSTAYMRKNLSSLGYHIPDSDHPIIPIMIGDAKKAVAISQFLAENRILAVAFSYPVVPQGKARIRLQVSAAHKTEHLERTLEIFKKAQAV